MLKNSYFLGIGGIGMSALAHILLQKGEKVAGSDLRETPIITHLRNRGAEIHIGHEAKNIKPGMQLIYSSAISPDNPEWIEAKRLNLPLIHRRDLLNQCIEEKKGLCVAGTHGKTTTTSLLTWVLCCAGMDPSFAIGGIPLSLNVNGHHGKGEYFVAETDESDGSFLTHPSWGAILTNLEEEHLDYWKSEEALIEGFKNYINSVQNPDLIFYCGDDPRLSSLCKRGSSYGFSPENEIFARNIRREDDFQIFDLTCQGRYFRDIELRMRGEYNLLNSLGVIGLSLQLGVEEEDLRLALKSFEGIKRRRELIGEVRKIRIYDDYAHHPTEIEALLGGFEGVPGRTIVIFQPHRYTRTRDCFEAFQKCFHKADLLICTEVYSAGETPIEGIDSAALISAISKRGFPNAKFVPKKELASFILPQLQEEDHLLTVGAGDITNFGPELLTILKNSN